MKMVLLAAVALSVAVPAVTGPAADPAQAAIAAYLDGWNRADAAAIAATFTADGDFIAPGGLHARDRTAIRAFYAGAFARGYRGSQGRFVPKLVRHLTPTVVVVDGVWSISGARDAHGLARPPERGLAVAILTRTSHGWQIAALREQVGATAITPMS